MLKLRFFSMLFVTLLIAVSCSEEIVEPVISPNDYNNTFKNSAAVYTSIIGSTSNVFIYDFNTRKTTQISHGENCQYPCLSNDGKLITYTFYSYPKRYLSIYDLEKKSETIIGFEIEYCDQPKFSPDSKYIIFNAKPDRSSPEEIYKISVDDKTLTRLTNNNYIDKSAKWSPDGNEILYLSNEKYGGGNSYSLYKMNPDGSVHRYINIGSNGNIEEASYSPSGEKILLVIAGDLYVVNSDGSALEKINYPLSIFEKYTSWSPYENYILFNGFYKSQLHTYLMDLKTRKIINLLPFADSTWDMYLHWVAY